MIRLCSKEQEESRSRKKAGAGAGAGRVQEQEQEQEDTNSSSIKGDLELSGNFQAILINGRSYQQIQKNHRQRSRFIKISNISLQNETHCS